MSKFIKISQQVEEQEQTEKKTISNVDVANIQKIKNLKGNLALPSVMAELTKISKGPGTEAQKEAAAQQYLQSVMNKLTPMAQFLNTIGVKIPRN